MTLLLMQLLLLMLQLMLQLQLPQRTARTTSVENLLNSAPAVGNLVGGRLGSNDEGCRPRHMFRR